MGIANTSEWLATVLRGYRDMWGARGCHCVVNPSEILPNSECEGECSEACDRDQRSPIPNRTGHDKGLGHWKWDNTML
jgi:hypothetical protein